MYKYLKTLLLAALFGTALMFNSATATEPVDINNATAQELALALTGIGSSKAAAIVAYRDEHGDFQHIDELVNVKGIGLTTIEKNREVLLELNNELN